MFSHITGHLETPPHVARRYLAEKPPLPLPAPASAGTDVYIYESDFHGSCIQGDDRKKLWSAYWDIVDPLDIDPWAVQYMMYLRDRCSHFPRYAKFAQSSLDVACCTFAIKVVQGVDGYLMPGTWDCLRMMESRGRLTAPDTAESSAPTVRKEVTGIELMFLDDAAVELKNIPLFRDSPGQVDWMMTGERNIPGQWLVHIIDAHYGEMCHCQHSGQEVVRWAVSKVMAKFPFVVMKD